MSEEKKEEIKIETLTDMFNAVKKHPTQLKILVKDIENMIKTTLKIEEIHKAFSQKSDLKIPKFFMWIPDNKNDGTINIQLVAKTKENAKENNNPTA